MTLRNQVFIWFSALIFFAIVLYVLRAVLMPFVAGMILAYFLDPLADRMKRLGIPRWLAATACLLVSMSFFVLAIFLIVPVAIQQLSSFATELPNLITRLQVLVGDYVPLDRLLNSDGSLSSPLLARGASLGTSLGVSLSGAILGSLWSSGVALLSILSLFIITPIVAFYLLIDWDRMISKIDSYLPRKQRDTIRTLSRDMDRVVSAFIRGQGSVCLLLGIFYAISLSLFGLKFGLLIGLFAGIISFIPFVGSLIGLFISVLIASLQFWPDYTSIMIVALIFLVGQFVETNILQPRIVGKSVGLHPVWLMFSLAAFGSLFGITGLLIAVPVSAALGVFVRFALQNYTDSSLYGSPSKKKSKKSKKRK